MDQLWICPEQSGFSERSGFPTSGPSSAVLELNQFLLGKGAAKPGDGFTPEWSCLGGAAADETPGQNPPFGDT